MDKELENLFTYTPTEFFDIITDKNLLDEFLRKQCSPRAFVVKFPYALGKLDKLYGAKPMQKELDEYLKTGVIINTDIGNKIKVLLEKSGRDFFWCFNKAAFDTIHGDTFGRFVGDIIDDKTLTYAKKMIMLHKPNIDMQKLKQYYLDLGYLEEVAKKEAIDKCGLIAQWCDRKYDALFNEYLTTYKITNKEINDLIILRKREHLHTGFEKLRDAIGELSKRYVNF